MSSWLRTAVSKAVEVGGKTNIRRAVRSIADSVSHQSVGGSDNYVVVDRIFYDRNVARDSRSFKDAAKRLEEVSVSCRGVERVLLLRRWLVALKEIERLPLYKGNYFEDDELRDSPRTPTIAYYYDSDDGGDPRNFRDVFLHSQALEGMVLSMILEGPNEEEVSLLMEIFRLCLTGGNDVHTAIMKSIQELAGAFLSYEDEVLVKREELLQYAQDAIAGLKLSADLARVDAEAYSIKEDLDKMKELQNFSGEGEEKSNATTEDLKEALVQVQSFAKLEALLLRKKTLSNGDTPQLHSQKLDKLKVLLESLANSTSKAEKRIADQRYQKEEALSFRMTKASEMSQSEKDLQVEIQELQMRRDELEDELKKVNNSLSASYSRLQNSREEKEQFDEASNQILVLLKSKEDELSRAIASYKKEVNIVKTWIRFLEGTWILQTSFTELQELEVDGELERYGSEFVSFVINLLSLYKSELLQSVNCIRELVKNLQSSQGSELEHGNDHERKSRKILEQELVEAETKLLTTSSVVDAVRKQFYAQNQGVVRKDEQKVKELFEALEKIKDDFESIERPSTRNDTTSQRLETSDDIVSTYLSPASEHVIQTLNHKPVEICALDNEAKQGHLESKYPLDMESKQENVEYDHTLENDAKAGNLESNILYNQENFGKLESEHTLNSEANEGYLQSGYILNKVEIPENLEYEYTLEKAVRPGNLETNTLDYEKKSGNLESEYVLDKEVESGIGEPKTLDKEEKSEDLGFEHKFENEEKSRNLESNKSGNEDEVVKLKSEYALHNEAQPGNLEFDTIYDELESTRLESNSAYAIGNEQKPGNIDSEYGKNDRVSLLDGMEIPTQESLMLSDHGSLSSLKQAIPPAEHEKELNKSSSFDEEKPFDAREIPGNLVAELLKTSSDLMDHIETTNQRLPTLYDEKNSASPAPTPHHAPQTSEQFAEIYSNEEDKPLDAKEKPGNLEVKVGKTLNESINENETINKNLPAQQADDSFSSPVPTPQHTPQTSRHLQDAFAEFFSTEEENPLDAREKPGHLEAEPVKISRDLINEIKTTKQSLQTQYDDNTSVTPVYTPLYTPQTGHEEYEFADFYSSEEEKELQYTENPENMDSEPGKISTDSLMDEFENQSQQLPEISDNRNTENTLNIDCTAKTYKHGKDKIPMDSEPVKVIRDSLIDDTETPSQKLPAAGDDKISQGTLYTEHAVETCVHGEAEIQADSPPVKIIMESLMDDTEMPIQKIPSEFDDLIAQGTLKTEPTIETCEHEKDEIPVDSESVKIIMDSLIDDTETPGQKLPAEADDIISQVALNTEHTTESCIHAEDKLAKPSLMK